MNTERTSFGLKRFHLFLFCFSRKTKRINYTFIVNCANDGVLLSKYEKLETYLEHNEHKE